MRRQSINDNDELSGIKRFTDFFLAVYREEIKAMVQHKAKDVYHSLHFNFMELLDFDMKLSDFLMTNPDRALEFADSGVFQAQTQLYNNSKPKYKQRNPNNMIDDEPTISIKNKCKARLTGQLFYAIRNRPTVSAIRSKDVNSIIQIRGTVVRQSKAKLLESSRKYVCKVCNFQFTVHADIINEKDIEYPRQCMNNSTNCTSKRFDSITGSKEAIDIQEIHLQEQIQKIGLGKIPRSIRVVLTCDLSDSCQPGDDVEIIGIVRYHWSGMNKKADSRFDLQMYIEAISIKTTDNISARGDIQFSHLNHRSIFDNFWRDNGIQSPIRARNMILANLCPQLCGMYVIKLAVALTIIGGMPREEYGTRIRGQSHLLLVGDPGTGKSQLLRYAARMSTRSVLTTGVGTTSAGLTVSAVKDGGEWVLEAGALVLADGGICCIDEFGSVREHDRGVIHEAMEQQTISVAKGGFVCSLNSRSTVLSAMNPPSGGFDAMSDLSLNTNMASSLLSRFDVILLLMDQKNDEWDRAVGQHLMDNLCEPEYPGIDYDDEADDDTQGYGHAQTPDGDVSCMHQPEWNSTAAFEQDMARFDQMREERVHWTIDQMQAYFTIIKQIEVEFTDGAQMILTEYYRLQRSKEKRDKSRTTIRLLESMIRLAQAHARLMYRNRVLPLDAIQTVYLMEKSLCTTCSISDYNVLQTIFPRNPEEMYEQEREDILKILFPRAWMHNKCGDKLEDIEWDYKEDIKQRELEEIAKMAIDDEQVFSDDDENDNGSSYVFNDVQHNKDVEMNAKDADGFVKPTTSLTQSLMENKQGNEDASVNDTPPTFGKRRRRNVRQDTTPNKEGELSHYVTPIRTTHARVEGQMGNSGVKRTQQEMMEGKNEDHVQNKRIRLNENERDTECSNISSMSIEMRVNTHPPKSQPTMETLPNSPPKENQNTQNTSDELSLSMNQDTHADWNKDHDLAPDLLNFAIDELDCNFFEDKNVRKSEPIPKKKKKRKKKFF
eukprot:328915_1